MSQPVIAGYVRTPFHAAGVGALASVRPDDLAALVVREVVSRSGADRCAVEDVILGRAYPSSEQGDNIARIAALLARLPVEAGGMTVSRFGGSSMSAIHIAAALVNMNAGDLFICGGVESPSRVGALELKTEPNPRVLEAYLDLSEAAEIVASQFRISRAEQEALALSSQQKATIARERGRLSAEIVTVATLAGPVDADGCLRPEMSLETLADMAPSFGPEGSVTLGTSAPLADGAAAMLVTSDRYASEHGLEVLARIRAVAVAGCSPDMMGVGAVPAALKALERAGLGVSDIGVVELHEVWSLSTQTTPRSIARPKAWIGRGSRSIAPPWPTGSATPPRS